MDLRFEYDLYRMDCSYNDEKATLRGFVRACVSGALRDGWCRLMHATVCKVRGHAYTITSGWATQDSGGETWECKRCHMDGGEHIYY